MQVTSPKTISARYIVFITLFTLLAFEFLLRLTGHNVTYTEQTGGKYESAYGHGMPTWFYTRQPNSSFDVGNSEFKYHYNTNNLGLREKDSVFTDSATRHILCLGDSYTEGYGAPYDSAWPKLMEYYLNSTGIKTEVFNAGVAGSDPFFEYTLYKYKLLPLHPNRLLICINATDFKDYIIHGGMSRFKADGTTAANKAPWFEPLYKYSYAGRFLINDIAGYTDYNMFVPGGKAKQRIQKKAMLEIAQVIDSLNNLAIENNCKLGVIIQQDILEFVHIDAESKYEQALFEQLQAIIKEKHIVVINLQKALATHFNTSNYQQYCYMHDSHYNGAGYNILAHEIINQMNIQYPGFW